MNIVDAFPREGVPFRTKPVYQYDYGQIIRIHLNDLPASYKVEFSNSTRADAIATVQTTDEVLIPAQFLTSGNTVYAWIVIVDESSRTTEYLLTVPVIIRARPTDTEPTPEEQSEIEQALAALNGAVESVQEIAEAIPSAIDTALAEAKASGEFDGPQGETGAKGETGQQGEPGQDGTDGVSPVVAITSITGGHEVTITDAEHPSGQRFNVMDGAQGPAGTDGQDGTDGISPEITVESITGGHRITITDADHPQGQSVDIMDGANGSDGRGIVSVEKTGTIGLLDTYAITYTSGSPTIFTVKNGAPGTPGTDGTSAHVWIRYASQQPTQDSDMSTTPGPWMGVYSGSSATAPENYTAYVWYEIKGDTGPVTDVQINGSSVLVNGVANVPIASTSVAGAVKLSSGNSLIYRSNGLAVTDAPLSVIKNGTSNSRSIMPSNQHQSAFYGLAKAAGDTSQSESNNAVGTYTDSALDKILAMLGVYALIGPHEDATASEAKSIGDVFIYTGKLYVATDTIAQGAAIVPGTNCDQTNLINLIRGI